MRRVFKTRSFARWSGKATLTDSALRRAIEEMTAGLIDADLGGDVYKKRVALPGRGKRGGARIVVATKQEGHWFLIYGFGKNEKQNIDDRELAALQKLAGTFLLMTPEQIDHACAEKELVEIADEEKPNPK